MPSRSPGLADLHSRSLRDSVRRWSLASFATTGTLVTAFLVAPTYGVSAYIQDRTRKGRAPVHWEDSRIVLVLESKTIPRGWDREGVLTLLQDAAKTWNRAARKACSALEIEVVTSDSDDPAVEFDSTNRIIFRTDRWSHNGESNRRYHRDKLAVTSLSIGTGAGEASAGAIRDADIELNAVSHRWRHKSGLAVRDLQATFTHEIGHVLGLAHSCDDGSAGALTDQHGKAPPSCFVESRALRKARRSVMFPKPLSKHGGRLRLSKDDRAALSAIYPRHRKCPQRNR